MTVWQLLEIPPTTDQRAIKRAYAKLLKQIDSEKDPESFLLLRQALEQALTEAQYLDEQSNDSSPLFFNDDQPPTQQQNSSTYNIEAFEKIYARLDRQIEQKYPYSTLKPLLYDIKSHIEQMQEHEQEFYLEKIAYQLYINDLEEFYLFIAPIAQQERLDLYNVPVFTSSAPVEQLGEITYSTQVDNLYHHFIQQLLNKEHFLLESTLNNLKDIIFSLSEDEQEDYLYRISKLLFMNDLENLFNIIAPLPQQYRLDIYNIPMNQQ